MKLHTHSFPCRPTVVPALVPCNSDKSAAAMRYSAAAVADVSHYTQCSSDPGNQRQPWQLHHPASAASSSLSGSTTQHDPNRAGTKAQRQVPRFQAWTEEQREASVPRNKPVPCTVATQRNISQSASLAGSYRALLNTLTSQPRSLINGIHVNTVYRRATQLHAEGSGRPHAAPASAALKLTAAGAKAAKRRAQERQAQLELLQLLPGLVVEVAHEMSAREAAGVLWAAATLRQVQHPGEAVVEVLVQRLLEVQSSWNEIDVANTAWALSCLLPVDRNSPAPVFPPITPEQDGPHRHHQGAQPQPQQQPRSLHQPTLQPHQPHQQPLLPQSAPPASTPPQVHTLFKPARAHPASELGDLAGTSQGMASPLPGPQPPGPQAQPSQGAGALPPARQASTHLTGGQVHQAEPLQAHSSHGTTMLGPGAALAHAASEAPPSTSPLALASRPWLRAFVDAAVDRTQHLPHRSLIVTARSLSKPSLAWALSPPQAAHLVTLLQSCLVPRSPADTPSSPATRRHPPSGPSLQPSPQGPDPAHYPNALLTAPPASPHPSSHVSASAREKGLVAAGSTAVVAGAQQPQRVRVPPRDLVNVVSSLVGLTGRPSMRWMLGMMEQVEAQLPLFSGREVVILLYSLARLQYKPHASLLVKLYRAALSQPALSSDGASDPSASSRSHQTVPAMRHPGVDAQGAGAGVGTEPSAGAGAGAGPSINSYGPDLLALLLWSATQLLPRVKPVAETFAAKTPVAKTPNGSSALRHGSASSAAGPRAARSSQPLPGSGEGAGQDTPLAASGNRAAAGTPRGSPSGQGSRAEGMGCSDSRWTSPEQPQARQATSPLERLLAYAAGTPLPRPSAPESGAAGDSVRAPWNVHSVRAPWDVHTPNHTTGSTASRADRIAVVPSRSEPPPSPSSDGATAMTADVTREGTWQMQGAAGGGPEAFTSRWVSELLGRHWQHDVPMESWELALTLHSLARLGVRELSPEASAALVTALSDQLRQEQSAGSSAAQGAAESAPREAGQEAVPQGSASQRQGRLPKVFQGQGQDGNQVQAEGQGLKPGSARGSKQPGVVSRSPVRVIASPQHSSDRIHTQLHDSGISTPVLCFGRHSEGDGNAPALPDTGSLTPRQLGMVMWALPQLHTSGLSIPIGLQRRLLHACRARLTSFSAVDLTAVLWSVARGAEVQSPGERWVREAARAAFVVMHQLGPRELPQVLWALAKLGFKPPQPSLSDPPASLPPSATSAAEVTAAAAAGATSGSGSTPKLVLGCKPGRKGATPHARLPEAQQLQRVQQSQQAADASQASSAQVPRDWNLQWAAAALARIQRVAPGLDPRGLTAVLHSCAWMHILISKPLLRTLMDMASIQSASMSPRCHAGLRSVVSLYVARHARRDAQQGVGAQAEGVLGLVCSSSSVAKAQQSAGALFGNGKSKGKGKDEAKGKAEGKTKGQRKQGTQLGAAEGVGKKASGLRATDSVMSEREEDSADEGEELEDVRAADPGAPRHLAAELPKQRGAEGKPGAATLARSRRAWFDLDY